MKIKYLCVLSELNKQSVLHYFINNLASITQSKCVQAVFAKIKQRLHAFALSKLFVNTFSHQSFHAEDPPMADSAV